MCGRYVRSRPRHFYEEALADAKVPGASAQLENKGDIVPIWNMPPGMCSWVWRQEPERSPGFDSIWWGLVPRWAQDRKSPRSSARSETVAELPSFKQSLRERRCLVPADGFFEWQATSAGKVPHYITHARGEPLFLAGIWDVWRRPPEEPYPAFAVLTTGPNELMASIHDRMPVIVRPEHYALWMDAGTQDAEALAAVYEPFPADELRVWSVSPRVNSTKNNEPELLEPVAT